ncbi:unnamed protein product [Ambrosiozyma monospora]|uniref:Unnamed protein product n=1 Tax=Ambrosiozyma monospora TaxID=43982 RepID=A0ACB5SUA0_AMBMO|nr:unnamed protein product [Ambrosiozyma monospora]
MSLSDNNDSIDIDPHDFEVDLESVVAAAVSNIYNQDDNDDSNNNNDNDNEGDDYHEQEQRINQDDDVHEQQVDEDHDGAGDLHAQLESIATEAFEHNEQQQHQQPEDNIEPSYPQQPEQPEGEVPRNEPNDDQDISDDKPEGEGEVEHDEIQMDMLRELASSTANMFAQQSDDKPDEDGPSEVQNREGDKDDDVPMTDPDPVNEHYNEQTQQVLEHEVEREPKVRHPSESGSDLIVDNVQVISGDSPVNDKESADKSSSSNTQEPEQHEQDQPQQDEGEDQDKEMHDDNDGIAALQAAIAEALHEVPVEEEDTHMQSSGEHETESQAESELQHHQDESSEKNDNTTGKSTLERDHQLPSENANIADKSNDVNTLEGSDELSNVVAEALKSTFPEQHETRSGPAQDDQGQQSHVSSPEFQQQDYTDSIPAPESTVEHETRTQEEETEFDLQNVINDALQATVQKLSEGGNDEDQIEEQQQQQDEEDTQQKDAQMEDVNKTINEVLSSQNPRASKAAVSELSHADLSKAIEDVIYEETDIVSGAPVVPSTSASVDSVSGYTAEEHANMELSNVINEALANVEKSIPKPATKRPQKKKSVSKSTKSTIPPTDTAAGKPSQGSSVDYHRAVSEALDQVSTSNDPVQGSSGSGQSEDDVLKEALAEMVQSVVETNLFPNQQSKPSFTARKSSKKAPAKSRPRKQTSKKASADAAKGGSEQADIESFQWNEMMEKAMEMAMENPENLISSMNMNDEGSNAQKSSGTASTVASGSTSANRADVSPTSSVAGSGLTSSGTTLSTTFPSTVNISMSSDAIREAARQRVAQIQQKLQRDGKIPQTYFPATTLEDTPSQKQSKKQSTKKKGHLNELNPIYQQFQKPPPPPKGTTESSTFNVLTPSRTDASKLVRVPETKGTAPAFSSLTASELATGAHAAFKIVGTAPQSSTVPLQIVPRNTPLINSILSTVNLRSMDSAAIFSKVGEAKIKTIKSLVDSAASFVSGKSKFNNAELDEEERKERIRLENRQRKKKWRETNIERNRDTDLRARVIKRSYHLYRNPEDDELRKQWVATEFDKRKQKRLERERKMMIENKEDDSDSDSRDKPPPLFDLLKDDTVLSSIASVSSALGTQVTLDKMRSSDPLPAVSSTAVSLISAYLAATNGELNDEILGKEHKKKDTSQDKQTKGDGEKDNLTIAITSLVNSLNNMFTRFSQPATPPVPPPASLVASPISIQTESFHTK